jgi:phosphatidylglycerophosphate synthase
MAQKSDSILSIPIRFVHERLGLSPNQVSTVGFLIGVVAALLVAVGFLVLGFVVMAISQIVDGLDGGIARRYNLQSQTGQMLEIVYDRLNELAMFLALAYTGHVTLLIAVLAFVAILLVTLVEPFSKFDPGFKRFMLYFGYLATVLFDVRGFQIAMNVVFFANLIAFVVGTIIADYRLQAEVDRQSIIRRTQEIAVGIPQPPDDPPSFLSKIFS